MSAGSLPRQVSGATSVEKSLAVCEALSSRPHGLSVSDLARSLKTACADGAQAAVGAQALRLRAAG